MGKRPAAVLAMYTGKCFAPEVNLREHIMYASAKGE